MAALKDAQDITRKSERDVCSAVARVGRAAEAERDAALADVTAWRGFAGSVAVAVHPGDAGLVIANHLAVDDLPDLLAAVERVVGERDRLRADLRDARVSMNAEREIVRVEIDSVRAHLAECYVRMGEMDEAALVERDRLRAVIAEAAADLPLHPEGAFLTPTEADAEAVRRALLAALRGEA
jgi:hypothetical protein